MIRAEFSNFSNETEKSSHKLFRDVAQPGSVLRSGRRGRRFESSHPDYKLKPACF
jgi:hypothetical protein